MVLCVDAQVDRGRQLHHDPVLVGEPGGVVWVHAEVAVRLRRRRLFRQQENSPLILLLPVKQGWVVSCDGHVIVLHTHWQRPQPPPS